MFLSELNRRDWLKSLGLGASAAALGAVGLAPRDAAADFVTQKDKTTGKLLDGSQAVPCKLGEGGVVRPSAVVPTISETDVLVVGGGPAGCVAAISAARAGAKTTLVERYGHFGGLATGGLVVHILGHWTKEGDKKVQATQGIGEEMMKRLEDLPQGIVNREFGRNPTLDAEAYKYLLVEMITEANIEVFLHSWAIDAIVDDEPSPETGNPVVRGVVIQTKMGPKAILAKQVIDATGDGASPAKIDKMIADRRIIIDTMASSPVVSEQSLIICTTTDEHIVDEVKNLPFPYTLRIERDDNATADVVWIIGKDFL